MCVCVSIDIVEAPRYCGLVLLQTVRPSHVLGQPTLKPCPEIKSARRLGLRHPGWSPIATPQKKLTTVSRMRKTVYFRWNQADCPDPNHDSNDHSEVTKEITRFLSILLSILKVWLLEIWPNAMPSCRKRSLMRYTMKLLEKSRGNKIIPTSAPQLGWTDIGREPRLWSNVYILSFVYPINFGL